MVGEGGITCPKSSTGDTYSPGSRLLKRGDLQEGRDDRAEKANSSNFKKAIGFYKTLPFEERGS